MRFEELYFLYGGMCGIFLFLSFYYIDGFSFGIVMSVFLLLIVTYLSLIEKNRRDKK